LSAYLPFLPTPICNPTTDEEISFDIPVKKFSYIIIYTYTQINIIIFNYAKL